MLLIPCEVQGPIAGNRPDGEQAKTPPGSCSFPLTSRVVRKLASLRLSFLSCKMETIWDAPKGVLERFNQISYTVGGGFWAPPSLSGSSAHLPECGAPT